MRRYLLLIVVTLLSAPPLAAAQDTPRLGVVMGYPAEIGILWTISDRIAVRPELTWSRSSTESTTTTTVINFLPNAPTTTITSSAENTQVGVGITGLFYLSKGDALRTYVGPRVSYQRVNTTLDLGTISTLVPATPGSTTTTLTSYGAAGSLGAQYLLGKRFAVFGELGLAYSHTGDRSPTMSTTFSDTETRGWTVAVRSGAGVVLFFGS